MKKTTMIIKAVQNDDGKYYLLAENGDKPQEGYAYATKTEAYAAAASIYPANSEWHGRKLASGYRIEIEPTEEPTTKRQRPSYYDKTMRQTAVWLPEEMITWLKSQNGTMSEVIREMIKREMEK